MPAAGGREGEERAQRDDVGRGEDDRGGRRRPADQDRPDVKRRRARPPPRRARPGRRRPRSPPRGWPGGRARRRRRARRGPPWTSPASARGRPRRAGRSPRRRRRRPGSGRPGGGGRRRRRPGSARGAPRRAARAGRPAPGPTPPPRGRGGPRDRARCRGRSRGSPLAPTRAPAQAWPATMRSARPVTTARAGSSATVPLASIHQRAEDDPGEEAAGDAQPGEACRGRLDEEPGVQDGEKQGEAEERSRGDAVAGEVQEKEERRDQHQPPGPLRLERPTEARARTGTPR